LEREEYAGLEKTQRKKGKERPGTNIPMKKMKRKGRRSNLFFKEKAVKFNRSHQIIGSTLFWAGYEGGTVRGRRKTQKEDLGGEGEGKLKKKSVNRIGKKKMGDYS